MEKNDALALAKDFHKKEIISIAEELNVAIDPTQPTVNLIHAVSENLESEGVPEMAECSDTLVEFLVAAGFMKDDGSIPGEASVDVSLPDEMPPCFSYAHPRDPACNRCRVFDLCMTERIKRRPPCFGKYSVHAEECKACLESFDCKLLASQPTK